MKPGSRLWFPLLHELDALCEGETLTRFVERVLEERPGYLSEWYAHFDRRCDFTGRQEHLREDLATALEMAGESFDKSLIEEWPRENVSSAKERLPRSLVRAIGDTETKAVAICESRRVLEGARSWRA